MITSQDLKDPNATPPIPGILTTPWPDNPFSDYGSKKKGKGKRKKRAKRGHAKKELAKKELSQLYFQLGYLTSQYEALHSMVGLAIAAKQGTLNDVALSSGLKALDHEHKGS